MAEKYPTANGNWSNAANWNGGTKPTIGDTAHANGKTITLDEDVTCDALTTAVGTTALAGGVFQFGACETITANITAGTTACVTNTNQSATKYLVGNLTGGISNTALAVSFTGTAGNLIHVGNGRGGSSSNASSVNYSASGLFSGTGNYTGAGSTNTRGVMITGGTGHSINGSVAPGTGSTNPGCYISAGTISISTSYGGIGSSAGAYAAIGGTITLTRAETLGGNTSAAFEVASGGVGTVTEVVQAVGATFPLAGYVRFNNDPSLITMEVVQADGTTVTLTDPTGSADYPPESVVSINTSYGFGTLTGTAILSSQDVIDAVAGVVGSQIAAALP